MNTKTAIALAGTAIALCAAESWINKDYTKWTKEETQKVLSNSPWARETTTTMAEGGPGGGMGADNSGGRGGGGGMGSGGGMGGGGGGGVGGGGGMSASGGMGTSGMGGEGMGGGGGRGGRGGGRGGMAGGMTEPQKITVRWESALPVKEALLKAQSGEKLPVAGEPGFTLDKPETDYVITVTGLQMPGMGGGGMRRGLDGAEPGGPGTEGAPPQGERPPGARPQGAPPAEGGDPAASAGARNEQRQRMQAQMRDRMLKAAQLVRKGKDPIFPTDMKIENVNGVSVMRFRFPKSDAISMDDKEVKFVCKMGPIQVERKFTLKEMMFNGKLEL
jgi:hypothetical protein